MYDINTPSHLLNDIFWNYIRILLQQILVHSSKGLTYNRKVCLTTDFSPRIPTCCLSNYQQDATKTDIQHAV